MANNAGLFDDSAMTDMSPRNLPPVASPRQASTASGGNTTAGATPPTAPTNAGSATQPPVVDVGLDLEEPIEQRQYTRQELRDNPALARRMQDAADRGEIVLGNLAGGNVMVYPRTGDVPGQPHIGPIYFPRGNTTDVGGGYGLGIDPRFTAGYYGFDPIPQQEVEIDASGDPLAGVRGYQENQPQTPAATGPGIRAVNSRAAGRSPTTAAGLTIGAPASTELSAVFDGINDTSRPLQPTREMRLADAAMRNDLERAQLYAEHGRPELAAEAFGRALQQRADYITQERTVMYRAAADGSRRAAERLIEEYNGYGRGEVQLVDAGNGQFNIQIQDENGRWVTARGPVSRATLLTSLQNLVDAEGAAARSEANQEYLMNVMDNQTELAIAGIVAETAHSRMFTDIQLERMGNDTSIAIAEGRAQVVQNEESGEMFVFYPRTVNGETYTEMERVVTGRQRSPDTNSNREVDVTTRTRVTGVNNVGAN
jgi:hypothetical protein